MTRYTQIINFTLQYLKIHNYLFSSSLLITVWLQCTMKGHKEGGKEGGKGKVNVDD